MENFMMTKDSFVEMKAEEQNQLQLERLQSTCNRAYRNVPFHRDRFTEMGIDVSHIQTLADIVLLPFMERRHFSENYPYNLFAVPLRDIVRIHTAPGTGHHLTVSGYTTQDLKTWEAILSRALIAADVTPHDILQISFHQGLANWGRDYKRGAEAIETGVIPNTQLSADKKLMVLRDYKTSVLVTTPAAARHLATHVLDNKINVNTLALKTLILTGEAMDADQRRQLEENLHVTTWQHYGLSEIPGPAIAFECEHHAGLHINEDHFFPEIIDPATGRVLGNNTFGELVLTTLTTRAFPLIRFQTGDRARISTEPCPCGRHLRRIEWYGERTDALIPIDGINLHRRRIHELLQQDFDIAPESAELAVSVRDDIKYLEIRIPLNDALFSDEIKGLERLIQRAVNRLEDNLCVPVIIHLKEKKGLDAKI
jgi:phenylacetate-CoA ligase